MRVIRILEYEGPDEWVRRTLANSLGPNLAINLGESTYIREILRAEVTSFGPMELKPIDPTQAYLEEPHAKDNEADTTDEPHCVG